MAQKLRIVVGLALLIVLMLGGWQSHKVKAKETMRAVGIPEAGLALIGSGEPQFDELAKRLLGDELPPELEALKPYSVVLYNHSDQTVVAYALRWEYTSARGRPVHIDLSDGEVAGLLDGATKKITGEGEKTAPTLPARSWIVVTPPTALKTNSGARERASDSYHQDFLHRLADRFSQANDISVTLDGAFFEDGSFIGPNKARFFENFSSEVRAKQNLMSSVVLAAEEGRSIHDIAQEVRASLPGSRPSLGIEPDGSISGYDEHYRYVYASQFLSAYHNSGEEATLAWAHYHLFRHPPKLTSESSKETKP
jgi:hypothetical protein